MNKQERDILFTLNNHPYLNQRALAEESGHSIGVVNRSLHTLMAEGYLDAEWKLTAKAHTELEDKAPANAIILAAGFGMRMVPINTEVPKALLEINGEPLIERLIRQLHSVGIHKIYVVVGFMKERFEYLIDEFDVQLIVNRDYAVKNNLHSLALARKYLGNSYIIPCDIWCDRNPFHKYELYSWYMVNDLVEDSSTVRVNRKMELVSVADHEGGNGMVGIAYLLKDQTELVKARLEKLSADSRFNGAFWEETLYEKNKMILQAKVVHASNVVEINTYEQLRELDEDSSQLKSNVLAEIAGALGKKEYQITDIEALKKGMTNRSFLFSCEDKKYIMRIPGEGTDQLINRREEAAVYEKIQDKKLCDDIAYINPVNGYKITEYLEGARVCDPESREDLIRCMDRLREFHNMNLTVDHEFDIFGQIEFYEKLWEGDASVYKDYQQTKKNVLSLRPYIEAHVERRCLTHIDAVPDNFLFVGDEIRLIDWEYAGMQDPHVDIAMFCIYALYEREAVEQLIDIYFENQCPPETRIKIYAYIAACGLLWSNWCEYKRKLGVEFGEYSLCQYRYAKDYFRIVQKELKQRGEDIHA